MKREPVSVKLFVLFCRLALYEHVKREPESMNNLCFLFNLLVL